MAARRPTHCSPAKRFGIVASWLVVTVLSASASLAQAPSQTRGEPDAISITKVANKSTVLPGDIVTYTVTVTNASARNFPTGSPNGGVLFHDTPPDGFRYVSKSVRIQTPAGNIDASEPESSLASTSGALVFGVARSDAKPAGIPLLEGESVRLTYQLRVPPRAVTERSYTNSVYLRTPDGEALTPDTRVTIRVAADPEFHLGAVLGRVFCDADGDGLPSPSERGVGGVRIFGDHGWKSVSDRHGKWHLRRMRPGNHLIKVDANSLPPGAKLLGSEKHTVYLTPGLVLKRDFAVKCVYETVSPRSVVRPRKLASSKDASVIVPDGPLKDVITVAGSINDLSIVVDGQRLNPFAAELTLQAPKRGVEVNFRNGTRNVPWAPGPIGEALTFETRTVGGPLSDSWKLQVYRTDGRRSALVRELVGSGQPPKTLSWDGTDATGVLSVLVRGGLYQARLTMADGRGQVVTSQPAVFGVSFNSAVKPVIAVAVRGKTLFTKSMAPGRALRREIGKLKAAFSRYPGARLLIGVHSADSGMPDVDMGRTRRGAFQTGQLAQKVLGLLPGQVLSLGYGATQPLRPVLSERDNRYNRRVELSVLPRERAQQLPAPPVSPARAEVNVQGLSAEIDGNGLFARSVKRPISGELALAIANTKGQRRVVVVQVPKAVPPKKADSAKPTAKPEAASELSKSATTSGPAAPKPSSADIPPTGKPAPKPEITTAGTPSKASEPKKTDATSAPAGKTGKKSPSSKRAVAGASGTTPPRLSLKRAPKGKAGAPNPQDVASDPLRRFGGDALRDALGAKSILRDELNRDAPVRAGDLKVKLPPKGLKINTKRLFISGTTHRDNRLTINGRRVHVGSSGNFSTTVPLPVGKSTLRIDSVDKAGNAARIDWPVEVASSEFFLMAIADGALGHVGARLSERKHHHRFETDDLFLSGRAALFFKGRISGLDIAKDLFVTAHVDTTKDEGFNAFYEQVIDPTRDYYVFGDASEESQVARARGPLYLLVELDRSKLTIGNTKTNFEGVELFRYNRGFYGIHLDFDKAFAEGWDTRVKAFVTDDQSRMARGHDEMRGTGGSLYHLSKKDIVKGSETLHLVVREMGTGMEMARHKLRRDRDYRVDYSDGRLFLKAPIPATMDSLFSLTGFQPFNGRDLLDGHEIWLVAEYESRDTSVGAGVAWGVSASQRIFKYVEVGGGYVQEGRAGGDDYEHMGVHLKVDLNPTSKAYIEFAQSLHSDGISRLSNDGGLSYRDVDRTGGETYGWGLKAGLSTHLGDLSGLGKDLDLTVKGWYQLMQPGFQALGNRQESGMEKWGTQILYRPTGKDLAVLRLDWMTSLVADEKFSTGFRAVKRNRYQLLYWHTEKDWRVGAEAAFGQHRDDATGTVFDTGAITVKGGYQVLERLELTLDQEFLFGGDDRELGPDYASRVATTLGAIWKLDDDIALGLHQEFRYNGDNATRIGLRTRLSPTANLYLEERIRTDNETGRLVGATVLGAEQLLPGGGRMYGEYRLDGGISGSANHAVFGIAKRFELSEGVRLTAAYERSQTLGAWEGVGARDVLSAGLEVLMLDFIKYGGRYELRFDRAPGQNQMQTVIRNGVNLTISDAVTIHGVANYALTQNLTTRRIRSEHLDASIAVAVRPPKLDWLTIGTSWKRVLRRSPLLLAELDKLGDLERDERTITDLLSLTSIFELPARLQLALRMAYRHTQERVTGLGSSETDYVMAIARLGFHLVENFDVAAEYRLLFNATDETLEHGALVEVSYNILSYARIGVGFNFSSFNDDLMGDLDEEASGFFVRLTGTY